jgi:hypothetical protein
MFVGQRVAVRPNADDLGVSNVWMRHASVAGGRCESGTDSSETVPFAEVVPRSAGFERQDAPEGTDVAS